MNKEQMAALATIAQVFLLEDLKPKASPTRKKRKKKSVGPRRIYTRKTL